MRIDESGNLVSVSMEDLNSDFKVVIPKNVKKVTTYAFSNVKMAVKGVEFEEGCEEIGNYAFEDCIQLTNIFLPRSLNKIGVGAFYKSAIALVKIPETVKYIGECAFCKCEKLKAVCFEGKVDVLKDKNHCSDGTMIEKDAFSGCKAVETFFFAKEPYVFGEEIWKFEKLNQIIVADDAIAESYWCKVLLENPEMYKFVDDCRVRNAGFREHCRNVMQEHYIRSNDGVMANQKITTIMTDKKEKCLAGGGKKF